MSQNQMDHQLDDATVLLSPDQFQQVYVAWKEELQKVLNPDEAWALVGIKRRGSLLARRLWEEFKKSIPALEFGEVDISLYRDDYHLQLSQPRVLGTEIEFEVDGCRILLIDDVLYTGRTVRAALNLILDFGRPMSVLLAVFMDRGHRELPITANFVGKEIRTDPDDRVKVQLSEVDGQDRVLLLKKGA